MDDNGNILSGGEPSSDEVNKGIKRLKEWLRSKNIKHFLKENKSGISIISGACLSIGATAISILTFGGTALALPIAVWSGQQIASRVIFMDLWNETQKRIRKKTGKSTITDKETAEYIMKLDGAQIHTLATEVCDTFKDDPEIKLFLADIVRNALASDEFKEIIGKILAEEIKKDMEAQHKEIIEEVRKCGIRSFYEILIESQKVDFKEVFEKFRRTIRLAAEERVCVIVNDGTIERTLENDVICSIGNGKNVLIQGISGSGKSIFLMKVCYKLHLEGWRVFFTNERVDSQKSRELLARTEGKKLLVIDDAARHDEYFDLIKNLKSDIRIVMAEQGIIWTNKKRSVKGYNFKELKLEFSEKEGINYIDTFGGNKNLLEISKNVFSILTYLVAEDAESLDCLYDDIWDALNPEEQNVVYPIFVLSSISMDYPRGLFNEIYDASIVSHIIDKLKNKNIIDVRESTISTIHPYLSLKIVERSTRDRFKEIDILLKKIDKKDRTEKNEYYDFVHGLGFNLMFLGQELKINKFFFYANLSLDICIEIKPKDGDSWHDKGVSLGKIGKHSEALECYEKALEIHPKDYDAWYNKGLAFVELSKLSEALECFEKALEINPNFTDASHNIAMVFCQMGKHSEELECYEKALEINPKDAETWFKKGTLFYRMGKLSEELECYEKALEINPNLTDALVNKGIVFGSMGKFSEALEYFEKALEINPKDAVTWLNKGTLFGKLGKFSEELECYEKALEAKPQLVNAWYRKGVIFGSMGKFSEALEYFEKALKINPKDADSWFSKGGVFSKMDWLSEALECYEKALEINPKDAEAWYNKGLIFGRMGKLSEAFECFEKALEINPIFAEAWNDKGYTFQLMHKLSEALECVEKALEIKPKYAEAWYHKGCIYSIKKDKENALKYLLEAIKIDDGFKEKAKKDDDFKWLKDDEDFKKLVG